MSDKTNYRERLKIPVDAGDNNTIFLTKCNTKIAIGYERIVIGARGPYIEFSEKNLIRDNIYVPSNELWRITDTKTYYCEYRSNDICYVKIYFQKKTVDYADYRPDFYYISPFDLRTEELDTIINSIKPETKFYNDKFFGA